MVLTIALDEKYVSDGEAYLHLPRMTNDEFYEFCQRNPTLNVERNAQGDVILMAPGDLYSETRNMEIVRQVGNWDAALETPGLVSGPAGGFTLRSGAQRAPDVAWIPRDKWDEVPGASDTPFPQVCPYFVVELMSPSDRLTAAKTKMAEWIANGTELGLLVDRARRRVYVYRPGQSEAEELVEPSTVSCEPELPGLILEMARVFA
jgi:Uma2 family endonuclease